MQQDIFTMGVDIGSSASKCISMKNGDTIVAKSLASVG
ncbi:2-hydroxyglutaryl-CoA dehydratase, partial [Staphylococcus aureus]